MKILIVDDHQPTATLLAAALRKAGEDCTSAFDTTTAIRWINEHRPDVVITDLRFDPTLDDPTPGRGEDVLEAARAIRPPAEVIVFTAHGDLEKAVAAMRSGAFDFLTKPATVDQLWTRLYEIRTRRGGTEGHRPTEHTLPENVPFLAVAPRSRLLKNLLERIAPAPAPVWISGEIGSGRGHAASYIHQISGRPGRLQILDPSHADKWDWPDEGTALLPDIDKLDSDLLDQLARRIKDAPPALRLIASSSDRPRAGLANIPSWRDVYYEIAVLVVDVPPLRDRKEDIIGLLRLAITDFSSRYRRTAPVLSEDQMSELHRHDWPGNLRELLNIAERMVIVGAHVVETGRGGGLAPAPGTTTSAPRLGDGFSLASHLESVEQSILKLALDQAGGDRREAGRLLNVERNALRYKLRKYGFIE